MLPSCTLQDPSHPKSRPSEQLSIGPDKFVMQNLGTARAVEGVVRDYGATPATIAVLGGVPHIGLTDKELELLASR
jgi:hypothetical protein